MATFLALWVACSALSYFVLVGLAWTGLLGEQARTYMTEKLDEIGGRKRPERQLWKADEANAADYRKARSAMNEAAGQEWRDLTEWRDD